MVLVAAASGSRARLLCCAGIGTTKLRAAGGTNENKNQCFSWINVGVRQFVEARNRLVESGTTDVE